MISTSGLLQLLLLVGELALNNGEVISHRPPCIHDKIAERHPHMVDLASQTRRKINKRQSSVDYSNIRIHVEYTNVDSNADSYVRGPNSVLSDSIKTLESILMVHPVQGNLIIPPMCDDTWFYGSNEGKCSSLPYESYYECGEFATIPSSYIGTIEVCPTSYGSCSLEGPDGSGLRNADYLLFVSATSSSNCDEGTLAYASHCMIDTSGNNRPVAGYINVCPLSLNDYEGQNRAIKDLLMHEMIHALGFSSSLFEKFVDQHGNTYTTSKTIVGPYGDTSIFTGPKTVAVARSYYSCQDIEGALLENEGGAGTSSSHWEKRTLNHELMNGYISDDYEVLSEFTVALLEDSGWYKANYTALHELNQVPLLWGKGLGCSFLNELCTDKNVYPYLCDPSDSKPVCTPDYLSKGNCSQWAGFDHCPVAIAYNVDDYCRAEHATSTTAVESFTSSSICVDAVRLLSSYTCGTYIRKPVWPLCVAQNSYSVNGNKQYVLNVEGQLYGCQDGHAVITGDNWIMSCPPTDGVVSRSPLVYNQLPTLTTTGELGSCDLGAFGNVLPVTHLTNRMHRQSVVSFGGVSVHNDITILLHVNTYTNATIPICQLFGCTTCDGPLLVDSYTVVSGSVMYLVTSGSVVVSAEFTNILTQAKYYSLMLMLNPQASHSFVYYAVSTLSNDGSFFRVTALTNNVEVRIAPSTNVTINRFKILSGEEYITILDIGESVMVTSSEDLTGSRVTANKAISFYSGCYCGSGGIENCPPLITQIPPFNSWGNSFILHTNVSGLIGNMFKLISSDIGASVSINCTNNGINYESNNYHLGFRQHLVLSITHHHCIVKSDDNILIIQFKDNSQSPLDTFMTIIPATEQFEDHYIFNANNSGAHVALTVMGTNPNINPILLDNNPATVNWETVNSHTYYAVLSLPSGRHTLTFLGGDVKFGATIYGPSGTDTYALPAGMKLNLATDLPSQAPSPVQDAVLSLVNGRVHVTWTPPVVPNGIIYQYIVQRVNSSGKFYHHVPANQHTISLPYFNDALVFVAAVNLYGQSDFKNVKSQVPCHPSPCINGGTCSDYGTTLHCSCSETYIGAYCESTRKLYPFGYNHGDDRVYSTDDGSSSAIYLSPTFKFYGHSEWSAYVNANGVISLSSDFDDSVVRPLPLTGTDKIIAPYWADVDTRGTGDIYYRQTTDDDLLVRATEQIRTAFPSSQVVSVENLLVATWDRVGYFPEGTNKVDTFQCVLATSGTKSFVIFLYEDLQWGGGEAVAGINAGDGINFITIPGSLSQDILSITETSNVGNPGVWMFEVSTALRAPVMAPRRFRAISTKSTSVTFRWNALSNEEANGVVRWYIITYYETDSSFVQYHANITGTATQGTVTGLTPHTTYTCTIYAVSGSDGPVSDPITVTTDYKAPNPPVILSVTTIDSQSVHVTWRAPTQPNGVLISYTLTYNIDHGSNVITDVQYNGRTIQSYDITGLAPYQLVTVTITATNDGGGTSGNSNVMMNRTREAAPGIVQFRIQTTLNNTEVIVMWRPPLQPNGVITSYEVMYQIYERDYSTAVHTRLESIDRSYTIKNLDPGTPYQVRVVAFTSVGMGVLGEYVVFFSGELAPTKAPENLQATQLSSTRVNITWTPLSLIEARGFPQYKVVLSQLSQQRRQLDTNTVITNNSFAVFTNLVSHTLYSVVVGVKTGGSSSFMDSHPLNVSLITNDDGDTTNIIVLVGGGVGGLVVIVILITVVILVVCYCRSQRKRSQSSNGYGTTPLMTDDDDSDDDEGQDQQAVATRHGEITSMVELET